MNSNHLDLLPDEMLLKLLLETDDLKVLFKMCQTSKRVNLICKDEGFWHNKYRKDYGFSSCGGWGLSSEVKLVKGETWREKYKRITLGRINSPISAGNGHYGIIDQNGNLYMVGANNRGQLGVGKDIKKSKIPILVKFPNESQKVISISMGIDVSGAVTKDGKVYIWGDNDMGLLPTNKKNIWLPKELVFPNKAIKIMVEYMGYIISLENSSVYFYSNGSDFGELAGTYPNDTRFKSIMGNHQLDALDIHLTDDGLFAVVTKDYKLYIWGHLESYDIGKNDIKKPTHIPLPEPVIKVSSRLNFPVVISITGNLYLLKFRLGIGESKLIKLPEKIVQIEGYYDTFAALSDTGRLYMWGENLYNQISSDQEEEFLTPVEISFGVPVNFVSIGSMFTIAVSNNGIVNHWGY